MNSLSRSLASLRRSPLGFVLTFASALVAFAVTGSAQTPTPTCAPNWAAGPNVPPVSIVRSVGVWFPPNGKFYSIGGRTSDTAGSDTTNPFEYDPATNTWTTKAALYPDNQVNNMACAVLTLSGTPQIVCVGGSAAGATVSSSRLFSYNPVTDTITTLSADAWPGNASGDILPGGFAVVDSQLFTVGGFQINVGMVADVWRFDPAAAPGSRWTSRAALPVQRGYVPTIAIGGMIYTAGGSAWNGTTLIDSVESYRYDPAANTWSPIATIPRATAETRAVAVGKKMWVLGGGRVAPNPSNEVDIYDPVSDTWGIGPSFSVARRNFPADTDGSRIWLAGGYAPTTGINTMEIYGGCPFAASTPTPSPTPTLSPGITPSPIPTRTPTPTPTPVPPRTPVPTFDFDGDRKTDISVTRSEPGGAYYWYQLLGSKYTFRQTQFGTAPDSVAPADYDGDGKTDLGIFRPSTGDWWWQSSIDATVHSTHWGAAFDLPLPGDVDGDEKADLIVCRRNTNYLWARLVNGQSQLVLFGRDGDKPLLGDYDGDGKVDLAIYRPSTGTFWYAASSAGGAQRAVRWGSYFDLPVPADYDGDGTTDIAVFSAYEGNWYIVNSRDQSRTTVHFGAFGDRPIPADYDGDGHADVAVFRPSESNWYLLRSAEGFIGLHWGASGDIPSPAAYIPQ